MSDPAVPRRFVQLPTDTERSSAVEFEAASAAPIRLGLPAGSLDVARQGELLGALVALLHRYTQQACIAVDVLVRDGAAERRLALDLEIEDDAPVSSVIDRARRALVAAAPEHAPREGDRPSNVAATFVLSEGSSAVEACPAPAPGDGRDAHFVLAQANGAALLGLSYNGKLIRPSTAGRLMDSYATLLGAVDRDPGTAIERLPLLGPGEVRALTVDQDSGTASSPPVPAHRLFEALARRQPSTVAASYQGQHVTYAELDEQSSRLANHLVECGVGPEISVGVCLRPSPSVLVSILAIWKAMLVAMFFMHLKFERWRLRLIFIVPIPLAIILVTVVIMEKVF